MVGAVSRSCRGAGAACAGVPSPAEGGATSAAAAGEGGGGAGVDAVVEYPHPDIPFLLEKLADPAYEAPRSWGDAETAHLVKLVEDPLHRR